MIGNPKWFNLRKYTGWGLTPNCWQGWVYILVFLIPVAVINSTTFFDQNIKNVLTIAWSALLLIDVIHIMSQIEKDERERLHEAIADRNALWFMIFVLAVTIFIKQIADPFILIALIGAALVKGITQFYLKDK